MTGIPTEILHQMFIHLPLFQRLECMLVCRPWWHTLHTCSLVYSVEISRKEMYNKFIAMIEQLPSRASHIQEITLSYCFSTHYDTNVLCTLFPNLRLVRLIDSNTGDNNTACIKQHQTACVKSKMNEISDYGGCELTCYLINANLCANLKTLQVHLSSTYERRSGVIPQLKNIPTLEYLTISDSYLTIDECETLHGNLPSVKSFNLDVVSLVESAIANHNQPAAAITSLTWRVRAMSFQDIDTHLDWCIYMSRKYTNLSQPPKVSHGIPNSRVSG